MYNILFIRCKFFTITIDEGVNILDHNNKVKSIADQLTYLDVPIKEGDVVMTLLGSLPPLFDLLITTLETHSVKELMLDFNIAYLMYEVSNRKDNGPQGDDAVMLSRQCLHVRQQQELYRQPEVL